ncbi:glycosyl transferase family 21-domain-containing protein [Catenaria anguillulae PL171]|uniref:Ceramide glucosyltransferase n=1 Tax=Catenaria anguillulae PL171 TaxID=765915 RepID=A0A1Y2HWS8_9FUNG|nr:glycosyl transferase family 21-domain-containing protein [Catenaria anguillulae PL171]
MFLITASSLPTLALAWWMFAMSIIISGVIASEKRRSIQRGQTITADASHDLPKVSILRPLKGLDCNIESNLLSSFRQDYPVTHFELIFCVADETDPVIPVVKSLIARHPDHNSRLVIGDVNIGVNPKINNLIRGYESASNDIVWIIDSNIWVAPGTLSRSVRALMAPGIGLVHHLPVGVQPTSLGSELEMLFLNSVHARAYLAINQLGPSSCVIGKSTLFRRSDLQICGGLQAFGKYMAEDNMIGQAIWDLGLRHVMTADRAWQPLGSMSAMDFFNRRQRWGRIRKFIVRAATLAEPLSECVLLSALFAYGVQNIPGQCILYFAHAFAWMLMDYWVSLNVTHASHLSLPRFARAWIIRELSCLPTYLWAMSGSTVSWRNFHYQLQPGGTVQLSSLPCDQSWKQLTASSKGPNPSSKSLYSSWRYLKQPSS